ncbi:hypothetical protein D3C85_1491520 [compost metagenome]
MLFYAIALHRFIFARLFQGDESHDVALLSFRDNDHCGFTNGFNGMQCGLNGTQLDPKTADFDLIILSTDKVQAAIG